MTEGHSESRDALEFEVRAFCEHAGLSTAEAPLRAALRALTDEARARYPDVVMKAGEWGEAMARSVKLLEASHREYTRTVRSLDADAYLAAACLARTPHAAERFERDVMPEAFRAAGFVQRAGVTADDALQTVREVLLVGSGEMPPRLSRYTGQCGLKDWVHLVAMRICIDLNRTRRDGSERELEEDLTVEALPSSENLLIRAEGQHHLREALEAAVRGLTVRERQLLRMSLVHGVGIDDLSPMYGAHRATVARWLQGARKRLERLTRQQLEVKLGLQSLELDSLMRGARSQFELSMERIFASTPGESVRAVECLS